MPLWWRGCVLFLGRVSVFFLKSVWSFHFFSLTEASHDTELAYGRRAPLCYSTAVMCSLLTCDSDHHRDLHADHSSSSWSWASDRMSSAQLALWAAGSRGAQPNRSLRCLSVVVSSSNRVASAKFHFLQHKHSYSDAMDTQRPQVHQQVSSVLGIGGYFITAGWTSACLAIAASCSSSVCSGS